MYFLLAKAAMRGYGWQIAFFRATLWEVVLDMGVTLPLELILLYYVLPKLALSGVSKKLDERLQCLLGIQVNILSGQTVKEKVSMGIVASNGGEGYRKELNEYCRATACAYGNIPEGEILNHII